MTEMDWAKSIAIELNGAETTTDEIAAALRKADSAAERRGRAMGWREAGNYVVGMAKEADNDIQSAAFIEAGFELIGQAAELEKLDSTD